MPVTRYQESAEHPTTLPIALKTLLAEAAGEGPEGLYAVASTMVNRARRRGMSLEQVVNQPRQYTGRWRPDLESFVSQQGPEVMSQARAALARAQRAPMPGIDHYLTIDLFRSSRAPSWAKTMGGRRLIGRHIFLDSQQRPEASLASRIDPLEAGLQHIYDQTRRAGFPALTARELAQIMERVEPPRALSGTHPIATDRQSQERLAVSATQQALRRAEFADPNFVVPAPLGGLDVRSAPSPSRHASDHPEMR